MPPRRPRRLLPATCCLTVMLVACGGESADDATSPLVAAFPEPSPADRRRDALRFEEVVAQCMREAGWEYTPVDHLAGASAVAEQDGQTTNPDYGKQFGYGVVRDYELFEWPYIDAEGNEVEPGGAVTGDPNAAYVAALSDGDRASYETALYGSERSSLDADGNLVELDLTWQERGCLGRGEHEVYEGQAFFDEGFSLRYYELQEAVGDDPAVADAEVAWSNCMYDHDAAYDFAAVADAEAYARQLLYLATGLQPAEVDQSTGSLLDPSEEGIAFPLADGTWIGFSGQAQRLTEEEIDAALADELALWTIDQKCRDESGLAALLHDREQEIADTLASEFPQYANGGEGGS